MANNNKKIWFYRVLSCVLGFSLLAGPIALLPRLTNQDVLDIHALCLKMPVNAFFKGLANFDFTRPIFMILYFWLGAIVILVGLIIGPLFFGRHFCGWLCPAGFLTEYLNKLVPQKLQMPFEKLDMKAIRYGFFTAFLLIPILGLGNMTCAFCNFNIIQGIFGLATFNADYLSVFATQLGWITLAWVLLFGVFSVGGRGYCNLFCPPGILSSLFHWGGSKLAVARKFSIDKRACNSCGECVPKCPMCAVDARKKEIDLTACITCHECQAACPKNAILYSKGEP